MTLNQIYQKILPQNLFIKNSPTIVKRGMLIILPKENFGIYRINDEILNKKDELKFNSLLNHEIKK